MNGSFFDTSNEEDQIALSTRFTSPCVWKGSQHDRESTYATHTQHAQRSVVDGQLMHQIKGWVL
jgi:hypothetical protein